MNSVNWLLINGGDALHAAWRHVAAFFGTVWTVLEALLNPVLSPVMTFLNRMCTVIGDGVYAVLAPLPVWLGLTLLSAIAGVGMLIAFRYTSNQAAIGRARDEITANLLALKLYKDEMRVVFRSQRRLLGALLRLQWHMLRPVLILLLPMLLMLGQMGVRYQWRPLHPGEQTLLTLHLKAGTPAVPDATLEPNPGVADAVGPVAGSGRLVWRIRGGAPGRHTLHFNVSGATIEKQLDIGDGFQRVSADRPGRRWTSQILHPVEPPLPADFPVQSIEIAYGGIHSWIYGANWWVLYFFVISMAFALLLKPVFKVRF